jgi:type VI secretion system protein ImpG
MNKHFQNELDSLNDIAKEFSEANPTLAPQLAQASSDPDAERILQGVAFLTAGIRQKIDDDFPEFSQGILNQVFPHYLRPIPSATIVQFRPKQILRNVIKVPTGTYMDSIEVDDISCRFRSTSDLAVSPIAVTSAQFTESAKGRKAIELSFSLNGINVTSLEGDKIRVHIGGDYLGAVDLFYILFKCLDQISLVNSAGREFTGTALNIQPVSFDESFKLLDYPSNSFPAYRLIQEYFLLKEKFLFFDITNLKDSLAVAGSDQFTVRLYLDKVGIPLPKLGPSRFVLHATPAINLFSHKAESFLNDYKRYEYPLRPSRNNKNQYQIYTVDQVEGHNRKRAQKNHYKPIGLSDPDNNSLPVFQTYSRHSEGQLNASYINFSYPESFELNNKEIIVVGLTCSNGHHARKLQVGDITRRASGTSEMIEFSNIIAPSESQDAPTGNSILWRLLSHLSLNYLSLADTDNLKALLELYIFPSSSGSTGNKQDVANRKRIEGIVDIKVKGCDRLIKGVAVRGQAINVIVNPVNFISTGDMYLFGMLLNHLLGSFSSLNSFTEFSLTDSASAEVYSWPIRVGDRPLI